MKIALPIITAILLALVVWNNIEIARLKKSSQPAQQQTIQPQPLAEKVEQPKEEYEIAVVMGRIHLYFDKLWFAGKAENWPLSSFYVHEMEEGFEELIAANVIDEGVEVSKMAQLMALPPLESLENAVKKEALPDFKNAYERMVIACNQCHQASKHSFIGIEKPSRPIFSSQTYKP